MCYFYYCRYNLRQNVDSPVKFLFGGKFFASQLSNFSNIDNITWPIFVFVCYKIFKLH